jgi:hypothetical protein
MASIASSLQHIKDNPLDYVDKALVENACHEHDYNWRVRELDPAATISLFMQQVVGGNISCGEVRHLGGDSFSAQAYCGARARIPLAVYQTILKDVYQRFVPQLRREEHLWNGHRTFHIDGSTFSMSDTPDLRRAFGLPSGPKEGCAFPVAHLLMLFSAATGLLMNAWASPLRTGDLAEMPEAHAFLEKGDILIGDDGFSGYPHLAMLHKQGLHGLFPVHHLRIVNFQPNRPHCGPGKTAITGMPRSRWIKSLGKTDQLVEYFKPGEPPKWMSEAEYAELPKSIIMRELRRTVARPGLGKITITLATTLLDPEIYPADELMDLRLRRWDVETNIGHLKTTMKMDVLHCQDEQGIRKELTVFCLVYNLVRVVMLKAARLQDVPVSRISFADAYHWMRHARPGDTLPVLIVNPYRPKRVEPRCKKRRPKQYDLMNKPRKELRKLLKNRRKKA